MPSRPIAILLCASWQMASLLSAAPAPKARPPIQRYQVFGTQVACSSTGLKTEGAKLIEGCTREPITLSLYGKKVSIPPGTWLDASPFMESIAFNRDWRIPVGINWVPVAKHDVLRIEYDPKTHDIRTHRLVLAQDTVLRVGNLRLPFHAKRYEPSYAAVRGQAEMAFHPDGTPHEGWLGPKHVTVTLGPNTIRFKGGKRITFRPDGSIAKAVMVREAVLQVGSLRLPFKPDDLSFHADGTLASGRLAKVTTLQMGSGPVTFEPWTLQFNPEGRLRSGYLAAALVIPTDKGPQTLKKGQEIHFLPDGHVQLEGEAYAFQNPDNPPESPEERPEPEEEDPGIDYPKLARKAAQGDPEAQAALGECFKTGEGEAAEDIAEAMRWFLRAARQGHADAQNEVGVAYLDGYGLKQNAALGLSWLTKAAYQGHPTAQYNLGICHLDRTRPDLIEAYVWLSLGLAASEHASTEVLHDLEQKLAPEAWDQAQARLEARRRAIRPRRKRP